MAKLKDLRLTYEKDGEHVEVCTSVSVTQEGMFVTTLPKPAVDNILEYGISLNSNRLGNPGYFEAKTLEDLEKQIKSTISEAMSRTLVEDNLVIKYRLTIGCHYIKDADGELLPNGYWVKNHDDFDAGRAKWIDGNDDIGYANQADTMLKIWAHVYHRRKYAYASGKEIIRYEEYKPHERMGEEKTNIDWINSIVHKPIERYLDNIPEIEATERNALFFVKMYQLVFKANEMLKDLNEPEILKEVLEKGMPKMLS